MNTLLIFFGILVIFFIWHAMNTQEKFGSVSNPPVKERIDESQYNFSKDAGRCNVQRDDGLVVDYIRQNLINNSKLCPSEGSPCKLSSLDDYRDEFFNFRNTTMSNSNAGDDTVDRVAQLYLENNSEVARGFEGMTIGEMFNKLTKY